MTRHPQLVGATDAREHGGKSAEATDHSLLHPRRLDDLSQGASAGH